MSELNTYISERKSRDLEFAQIFDAGYEDFKIGVILKELRLQEGITQDELAAKMNTKKSVISRMENHSEDIRISTLHKVAHALGKKVKIAIV